MDTSLNSQKKEYWENTCAGGVCRQQEFIKRVCEVIVGFQNYLKMLSLLSIQGQMHFLKPRH